MVSLRSGKVRESHHQILGQSLSSNYQDFLQQKNLQEQRDRKLSGTCLVLVQSAFRKFCDQTSLHGYSYLIRDEEKPNHLLHQIIWIIVILVTEIIIYKVSNAFKTFNKHLALKGETLTSTRIHVSPEMSPFGTSSASICLSLFFMMINWDEFSKSTTVTGIQSITSSLTKIYFPSVLVCNINQVTLSFLASLNLTENNLSDQKLIDKLFRRFIRANAKDWTNITRREMLYMEEESDRNNFSGYTLNGRLKKVGYNGSVPVLQMSSHKNNDTILSAKYKSLEPVYFFDSGFTITDYGACSVIYPHLDFENPKTRNLSTRNYDGATFYGELLSGVRNGVQNGLQLVIDAETFDYAYHHRGSKGFMISLADQRDRAIVYQNGFYVSVGTENLVGISVERSFIGGNSRFNPKDRDCYFDEDFEYKYLRRDVGFRAALTNCLYEAVAEHVISECECKPFFITFPLYPNQSEVEEPPQCSGIKLACMQYFMDHLGEEKDLDMKRATSNKNELLDCRQRCSFQTEKVTVTTSRYPSQNTFLRRNDICKVIAKVDKICSVPLRRDRFLFRYSSLYPYGDVCATNDYYFNFMGICFKNFTLNTKVPIGSDFMKVLLRYANENLTVLKIYFKEPYHTSIVKKDKITYINFIGTVGGLLGLCMGLSCVSVAELIFHFGRFFYNLCKSKK